MFANRRSSSERFVRRGIWKCECPIVLNGVVAISMEQGAAATCDLLDHCEERFYDKWLPFCSEVNLQRTYREVDDHTPPILVVNMKST